MNDDELLARLRRLGADHEPDTEAIWARIDPARDGVARGAGARDDVRDDVPVVSLDGRRDRALRADPHRRPPRPAVLLTLAAAAVLGVLAVDALVTRPGDVSTTPAVSPAGVPGPVTTVPPAPSPSAPTSSASTDVLGTPVATTAPTRSRTVTATADGPAATTTRPRPPSTSAPGDLGVPAPSLEPLTGTARRLLLTTPEVDDWVVTGARRDGIQVRAKRPAYPQALLFVRSPAGAAVVGSPLLVSWGDGVPEQSRVDAATWQAGGAGGAWTVTTQRLDVPRRLTITGGGAPSGLRLDVVAPGRRGSWTWAGNPAGSGPFSLSVVVPGGAGPVTVTLAPLAGERLAVSAVSAARI